MTFISTVAQASTFKTCTGADSEGEGGGGFAGFSQTPF